MQTPPRHPDMPPIPQDDDGPIFREPWEAQAFAIVLHLCDAGHFTWNEWVDTLSAEIARVEAAGDPDLGDRTYHHWLAALETVAVAKGLTGVAELAARKAAWAEADHHRGFGEPIVLGRGHGPGPGPGPGQEAEHGPRHHGSDHNRR